MKQIGSHKNVLSMLGYWVKSEPIMLILEYVPHGDLLQWLRNKRQQVRKLTFFLTIVIGSENNLYSQWKKRNIVPGYYVYHRCQGMQCVQS